MSTILKTLKKLEEDKKLLERDLDLKELVLQEDQRKPVILDVPGQKYLMTGLILTGVIVASLIFVAKPSDKNKEIRYSQAPPAQETKPIERQAALPTVGIPLSNISEQHLPYEERVSENPSLPVIEKEPVREIFQPVKKPDPLPQEINEIRDLIRTATLEQKQPNPYPEELISSGISIPNLKVKGIIFFSSGSPSNHIFVSTAESKNRKIRVGDTVQSATLMHIESNRVVFSYQGETVHLRIGE